MPVITPAAKASPDPEGSMLSTWYAPACQRFRPLPATEPSLPRVMMTVRTPWPAGLDLTLGIGKSGQALGFVVVGQEVVDVRQDGRSSFMPE